MDVSLITMITILSPLPNCPEFDVKFRRQIANFMQATKHHIGHSYMTETIQGVKLLWETYHFSSNVRDNVIGEDMIFLTPKDKISMGEGENRTFHLVLSCRTLLENVKVQVPYTSVMQLPAHFCGDLPPIGPAQLHIDETYRVLKNNYPVFSFGCADVQLRLV